MRGQSGEERLGSRIAKPMLRQCHRRGEADQPETREQKRMPGEQMNWTQDFMRQFAPVLSERAHKPSPLLAVFAQRSFCLAEITLQHDGRAVVERVRQGRGRMYPL